MKKILLFAFLVRIFFIFGGYHPDLGNHLDWGKKFWEYGPKDFYSGSVWSVSWPNQPPGTIYLWAWLSKINDILFGLAWRLNLKFPFFPSFLIPFLEAKLHPALVKLPSILAEVGIGWLIYKIILSFGLEKKKAAFGSLLFLFNPAVIYNSSVWGQTDGLVNFFVLLFFWLSLKEKYFWAILSLFFSFYFKLSLLIFLPIIFLFLLKKIKFVKTIIYSLSSCLFFFILSLPFTNGNPMVYLAELYINRILGGQGNMLTANAFNLWGFLFGIDFARKDSLFFLSLTYRVWGYLLFVLAYGLVIRKVVKDKLSIETVIFSFALVSFFSFVLLTNMHERYLYPLFPYLSILVIILPLSLFVYLAIALIHFFNLYHLWYYPKIFFLERLMTRNDLFIVKTFSLVLIILSIFLFSFFLRLKSDKITLK